MPKLFITGTTGYIGGDALYAITKAYPDLEVTAIVRNSDKGGKVAAQYPKIRLVYGDLDSTELLTTEAAKADVVVHTANCDHEGSANAIIAGLAQRAQSTPGYLIHTSGTGILCFADVAKKRFGVKDDKVYDDWEGIKEVTSLPDAAVHRNVDKIILAASEKHAGKISTAIVCPPCIYGPGRGPDNTVSMQAYRMASATLRRGKGFHGVNDGNNIWSEVHIQDLSNVYASLVGAALDGGGKATWNAEGYYFAENGELVWGEIGKTIARLAAKMKLIDSKETGEVGPEEADKLTPHGSYLWGYNSRSQAVRARNLLGWKPKEKSLLDLLPEIVEGEAKALGLVKGHAEQAAG